MERHDAQNQSTPHAILLATPAMQATAAGAARIEGGQPVRRFTKELIRCGDYVKASDSIRFSVTPERLKQWVATSSMFLAAGNKIPVPISHTKDPAANRGWVVDVWEDGKSLYGAIDLVGEDGIRLAGTTDVSLCSVEEYTDGKGNRYTWPIVHVALCTDPVIPGLGGFVPIQASLSGEKSKSEQVPVFFLKLQGASPMPDPITDPNASAAGDPAEAIVAAITDKVMALVKDKTKTTQEKKAAFGDLMKKLEKALGVFDDPATPADESAEPAPEVAASLSSAKPDPFVVKLARENYTGKLNGLVAAGKITPAVRDALATQYLADAPLSLALGSKNTDQLDGLLSALDKNAAVVPMGEKTGQQTLSLSRSIPAGDEAVKNRKEAGDELRAMTARAAGLKPAK